MIFKTRRTKHIRQQRKIMGIYIQVGMKHIPKVLPSQIVALIVGSRFSLPNDSFDFSFTVNSDGSIDTGGGDTYTSGGTEE